MSEWLSEVGEATLAHREGRANGYEREAEKRRARARLDGASEESAQQSAKWHASRAKGQRERIERVEDCGKGSLVIRCQSCGLMHERPVACGSRLLCVRCRGARARVIRVRFSVARASVLTDARRRGLLNPHRRGGAWGEKFLTLTVPHLETDTVEGRIVRVLEAWKWFVRCLQKWQRSRDMKSLEWFRVFEWTPGGDALGHPHLHIWVFSPFLDAERLRDWWRDGIRRQCPDWNDNPVIDIRAISTGIEQELIKYLTKDIDEQGDKIAPNVYALVYCALDRRRALQSSRGFMARADKGDHACIGCGSTLPRNVARKLALPTALEDT